MKKIIILLTLIFIVTLSACTNDAIENEVTFNIENYFEINHFVGDDTLDLTGITASNKAGDDLTDTITTSSYGLQQAGSFEVTLEAKDEDGTVGNIITLLIVKVLNCETYPEHERCIIDVDSLSITNVVDRSLTLYPGDEFVIGWDILPSDATNKVITLTSSNEDVVSVLYIARIKALEIGESEITMITDDGSKTQTFTVTVVEKTCAIDPTQDKCYLDILDNDARIVTISDPNISGTDYTTLFPKNDLYYEIFVRKYASSDSDNVGDFNGITETLPYLKSLGVSGIWLMPIMESRSDHGYETDDYFNVDEDYGTMADFEALIAASHEEDIDVIIDLVLNHMGASNDIFQDVLRNGVTSDYYDWFVWADSEDPRVDDKKYDGGQIWYTPQGRDWLKKVDDFDIHPSLYNTYYYALFSDWMPDLNLENPDVVSYLYSVAEFWLTDVGVDGFRLDATSHFYHDNEYNITNSHEMNVLFLQNFNTYLKTINPDVYVVAEAWEDYNTYATYYASEISMFDFQAMYYIKDSLKGYSTNLSTRLATLYNLYDNYDSDFIDAVFLSNHDMDRLSRNVDIDGLKLGAQILLTLPGNPYIYYGDEVGIEGTRTSMIWGEYYDGLTVDNEDYNIDTVSEQLLDEDSLLQTYTDLGTLRENSLALRYGNFIPYNDTNGLEGYYRVFENGEDKELLLVLFNYSDTIVRAIPSEFISYEILYASNDTNFGGISQNSMMIIRLPYHVKDTVIN